MGLGEIGGRFGFEVFRGMGGEMSVVKMKEEFDVLWFWRFGERNGGI